MKETGPITVTLRPLSLMSTPDQKGKKGMNYLNSGMWIARKGRSGHQEPKWIEFE